VQVLRPLCSGKIKGAPERPSDRLHKKLLARIDTMAAGIKDEHEEKTS
jgi:hypothetical protein